jgi:ribosome biogenesis GTPase A
MSNYWRLVNDVIKEANILLEVLDARTIDETRNIEIEDKVRRTGKTLIYVINKCDLVDKEKMDKAKKLLTPCVFMSAKDHLGTSFLRSEIMKHAPKEGFKVGVLGYPNTGKSSVINALKGRASASTSSISGHTHGIQLIKINQRMYLLDTPGVFPYQEKDEVKHAITSAKTFSNIKDPELAAIEIIGQFPEVIEGYYGVKHDDAENVLDSIALKMHYLKKGGLPDTYAAARRVLKDWQEGKIRK